LILDDNNAYLHIFLRERRFFKRLLYGIKYIFGYKCKYGHWDEIILNDTHSETLMPTCARKRTTIHTAIPLGFLRRLR
jgi:hypothetical protein